MTWLAVCPGQAGRGGLAGPAHQIAVADAPLQTGLPSATAKTGAFEGERAGQSRCASLRSAAPEALAHGAVVVEHVHTISNRPENILRYRARDPVLAGLSLRLDPDGALWLLLRQGTRTLTETLPLPPLNPDEKIRASYHWRTEGGATAGLLLAFLPARGIWLCKEIANAATLTRLDADRIGAAFAPGAAPAPITHCTADAGLVFAAIADHALPAGPLPGIDGRTAIATPTGKRQIATLAPGCQILSADGTPATVLHAAAVTLPAFGSLAPHVMRAPFYGLRHDMVFAGAQPVHMSGTEVEYLFFREEVAVSVADLVDQRAVTPWESGPEVTYHQVVLDRPALMQANGAALPPLDIAPLLHDTVLRRWSLLAGYEGLGDIVALPAPMPTLRDFEAASLRRMRAA